MKFFKRLKWYQVKSSKKIYSKAFLRKSQKCCPAFFPRGPDLPEKQKPSSSKRDWTQKKIVPEKEATLKTDLIISGGLIAAKYSINSFTQVCSKRFESELNLTQIVSLSKFLPRHPSWSNTMLVEKTLMTQSPKLSSTISN